MKKIVLSLMVLCVISLSASAQFDKLKKAAQNLAGGGQLSSEEIANGLKEALTNGISKGSDIVSQLDGYFKNPEIKLPFPPEAQKAETKLRQMGMGAEVDKFVLSLNRAAEDAAKCSRYSSWQSRCCYTLPRKNDLKSTERQVYASCKKLIGEGKCNKILR
jgi:hypothetical protein